MQVWSADEFKHYYIVLSHSERSPELFFQFKVSLYCGADRPVSLEHYFAAVHKRERVKMVCGTLPAASS
jgi:hypothetical protein